jgi:hypothetical protein
MNVKSGFLAVALLLAATLPATSAEPLSNSRIAELKGQFETALRATDNPTNISVIIAAGARLGSSGLPIGWNTVTVSYCWEYQVSGGPDVIDMVDTEGDNFFTSEPSKRIGSKSSPPSIFRPAGMHSIIAVPAPGATARAASPGPSNCRERPAATPRAVSCMTACSSGHAALAILRNKFQM